MSDSFIKLPPDSTGKLLDTAQVTVGLNAVQRERHVIADNVSNNYANVSASGALQVDNSAVTQPISAASLPLPSGASTAAKQPAIGTAGSASADVLTVQGVASMIPVLVDGSATTQPISAAGLVDINNSTSTPLGAGGVFTGTATNLIDYVSFTIFINTDQSGTLQVQWGSDGTTWPISISQTITATTPEHIALQRRAKFYRVVYTNGSTPQTSFTIQTILTPVSGAFTTTTLSESVNSNDTGLLTKSVIVGVTTGGGGGYVAVKVNPSGTITADASGSTINVTQIGGAALTEGQKTMSASIPVVVASDQSAVKVDGSAVTQPVSGTVTVTQSTASNLKVDLSDTATNATAIKVDGSAVTQPVSGTVTANQGGTWTVQPGNTQNTTAWLVEEGTTLSVTIQRVSSNPSSSGDNTIISAPGAGKNIYVFAYSLSFSGTVNAKFTDGAAGTQRAFHYGVANSGGGESTKPPAYLWQVATNTALVLNLSGATATACNVSYFVI